jgi:hypothetical protein
MDKNNSHEPQVEKDSDKTAPIKNIAFRFKRNQGNKKKYSWTAAKRMYHSARKSRFGFILETIEEFFSGSFSGFMLGGIAIFFENSSIGIFQTLYTQFGESFLHHYVGFPVGLLYVTLILTAIIMAGSERFAKVFRLILVDPVEAFIFHTSAITSGAVLAGLLFGHVETELFTPIKLIIFLTITAISVRTMVEYAAKAPKEIEEFSAVTPEEKRYKEMQAWGVLIVAAVAGLIGSYCLWSVS